MRNGFALLTALGFLLAMAKVQAAEKPADPDEALLRSAGLATDDAGLLAYLRNFAKRDDDLRNLDRLIRLLGGQKIAQREEASKKLAALGLAAQPALRKAGKDRDQEVSHRARAAIDGICGKNEWAWIAAASRRLLKTAPAGTTEALLAALPYAVDEGTEQTIWFGLEELEPRVMLTTFDYVGTGANANWTTAKNWVAEIGTENNKHGYPYGPKDTAVFNSTPSGKHGGIPAKNVTLDAAFPGTLGLGSTSNTVTVQVLPAGSPTDPPASASNTVSLEALDGFFAGHFGK
jgi:hypothetical protein